MKCTSLPDWQKPARQLLFRQGKLLGDHGLARRPSSSNRAAAAARLALLICAYRVSSVLLEGERFPSHQGDLMKIESLYIVMLSPKRTKFRKQQRGRMRGKSLRGNIIAFGDFALQALEPCWITSRQIEAGRRAMTRYARRGGKLWIRIFPDKPVTKRAADTRMGSGKGSPEYWVAVVKPGKILYEMRGVSEAVARSAMRIASYKMPIKTQFLVKKGDL